MITVDGVIRRQNGVIMKINVIFYSIVIVCHSVIVMAKEENPANKASLLPMEIVASDETGTFNLRWRMPARDSAFVIGIARGCGDSKFRNDLLQSLKQNKDSIDIDSTVNDHHISGEKNVDKKKANFTINQIFSDRNGIRVIQLNMPASQAIGVLKALFVIGDSHLKYQVMRFGFKKYENKDVKTDILAFLTDAYNDMDIISKGEIMIFMFSMDANSPYTRSVLEKNEKLVGTGELETNIRQIAHDMLECLNTGDMTRLKKYKVTH